MRYVTGVRQTYLDCFLSLHMHTYLHMYVCNNTTHFTWARSIISTASYLLVNVRIVYISFLNNPITAVLHFYYFLFFYSSENKKFNEQLINLKPYNDVMSFYDNDIIIGKL